MSKAPRDREQASDPLLDQRIQAIADGSYLNTAWLLHSVFEALEHRLLTALHAAEFQGLRRTHLNLVRHLAEAGARMSDLAAQANLTKAGMTALVRECEALGLVNAAADPNDGRVRIVMFTTKGKRLKRLLREELLAAEHRMVQLLGAAPYRELRVALMSLYQPAGTPAE